MLRRARALGMATYEVTRAIDHVRIEIEETGDRISNLNNGPDASSRRIPPSMDTMLLRL
jgi:hypothetical protein